MPSVKDRKQTDRVIILANPNPSPCSVTQTYNLRRAMVMAPLAGDSHRGWTSRLQSRPSDQLRPSSTWLRIAAYTGYHSYTINVRTRHSSLQNMQKSTWSLCVRIRNANRQRFGDIKSSFMCFTNGMFHTGTTSPHLHKNKDIMTAWKERLEL